MTRLNPNSQVPSITQPVAAPQKAHGYDADLESVDDKKRWSDTQASRTPTRPRRARSIGHRTRRSAMLSRSDSLSTIDGGHNPRTGAYKVVINQTRPGVQQPGAPPLPTIEVPIPHYRLGTPRFSTRGTAFLHSAVYSRASTNDELDSSAMSGPELDGLFPVPPGMEAHTTLSRRHSHATPQPHTVHITPTAVPRRLPIPTSSPVFHRAKEPIAPGIFDAIAVNPDDPAIVRYAMSTREISAASPARIIAQITSKNFLDYELLSDFFLTVRAYMSTHDVMAYLLARFEWAINRFDDDGRVIRVRAFAAIRHWVLNYFPYDFVVDRDLRVKFCEHLNAMARYVRVRTSHEPSDLKLIVDLKKCWNGRCALYWDNPQAEMDGRNDLDISPGGIVGSRDSRLTHPSELWAKLAATSSQQLDQEKSVAALHNWVDSVIEAEVDGRSRSEAQHSIGSAGSLPTSPLSEQSFQALSCSIPGRALKGFAAQGHRNAGPHPIPTAIPPTMRRVGPAAPSAQANERSARTKKEHKRSGSWSDAFRDNRTALPSTRAEQSKEQIMMNFPFSGSLVRGSVLPPGSPFIDNLARQGSASNSQKPSHFVADLNGNQLSARPMSPGVRNLLGSIRRAWGSKPSSAIPTSTLLSTAPFMIEAKNSTLPMHIAYKIEGRGDLHHQLEALKKNSRIDLLCADITDMFERAMTQQPAVTTARASSAGTISGNERGQSSLDPRLLMGKPQREILTRNHSGVTYGSRSIVIMDDTSSEPPVPSVPGEFHDSAQEEYSTGSTGVPFDMTDLITTPLPAAFKPPIPAKSPNRKVQEEGDTPHSEFLPEFTIPSYPVTPAGHQDSRKSKGMESITPSHQPRPSITTGRSFRSTQSGSKFLRKSASYQSGMRISGPDYTVEATTATASPPGSSSTGAFDIAATRMLRRRPGGDLRANQNVHDLEPAPRPLSTGSITTYTDSIHNSVVYLKRAAHNTLNFRSLHITQPAPLEHLPVGKKSLSLVRPLSSKPDLRPSFEAAVAEFARIPDDEGGDLEATLAKLEGKFKKSPSPASGIIVEIGASEVRDPQTRTPKLQVREQELGSEDAMFTPPGSVKTTNPEGSLQAGVRIHSQRDTMTRSLYAESEESYNSIPLLERDLTDRRKEKGKATPDPTKALFSQSQTFHDDLIDASDPAAIGSDHEATFRRGRYRSSVPTATTDSFLLDEDEFLSDLSSELSEDLDETNTALDEAYDLATCHMEGRPLPPYSAGHLPSPPMTTENALAVTSEANRMQEQRKPPTPEPSPVSRHTESSKGRTPGEVDGNVLQPFATTVHQFPSRRHIPFILAFDAAIIAQQFTIVERDALNEINWQDLIDMRWNHTSSSPLNWVEYLRFEDPTGIELVTARFNITVKWAISEIVLTHNPEERALTIMKYIQVAQNCRKLHNYATLLQLTIAVTSIDCTRLTRTWALVPDVDKASLKEMETLVSPLRNFHNMRVEMETANLENGCIPVVGKY